jgi:hypothetical protein
MRSTPRTGSSSVCSSFLYLFQTNRPTAPVFNNLPNHDLYPALGLRTANEHVRTNFGDSPFRFDIDAHVAQIKVKAWRDIHDNTLARCRPNPDGRSYQIDSLSVSKKNAREDEVSRALKVKEENLGGSMADLVLEYLMFQGYASTARQFHEALVRNPAPVKSRSEALTSTEESMDIDDDTKPGVRAAFDTAEQRARIMGAVIRGDIDTAITLMKTLFPSSLAYDGGLVHFKLRCRRFVELILEAYEAKRRISKEADTSVPDVAGSGAVATEGANAMDLDNEEGFPLSPTSRTPPWSINGGAIGVPITSPTTKSKGKQPARRRSSASRPSGSLVRANSRTRGGTGSLISPMAPSVSREETSEVAEHMQRLLDYGTSLSKDWEGDERQFVRDQLRRTVGLVAYEDPYLNARSKELVSPEARLELAEEVNKAILGKSSLL